MEREVVFSTKHLNLQDKKYRRRCKNNGRCSVINLRIPFGKVEEWDVPQSSEMRMEHRNLDDQLQNDDEVMCNNGIDSDVDNTAFKNTPNPMSMHAYAFFIYDEYIFL